MRTIERNGESELKQKISTPRPPRIMALKWTLLDVAVLTFSRKIIYTINMVIIRK